MKLLTLAVVSACGVLLADGGQGGEGPLVLRSAPLRAVASAYADLRREPERGAPVEEFEARIYETDARIEIIFSRVSHHGMERRGGGWFYAVDTSSFVIVEKRHEK